MLASPPSLLITDDDQNFRETLQSVFEPRGFRTLLASDGQQALEIVRGEPVHVVITDMHMPELTGLEMIRSIRQFNQQLPCILLSARPDDMLFAEAETIGVFAVQRKPITRRKITLLVNDALRTAYNWAG